MTLREIELFLHLCRTSSISKSAKLAGISQSAASLSIKSLENDLGELLFDRIGKKLILNERGREFKKLVYEPYNSLMMAKESFGSHLLRGLLYVATSRTIGDYIMPQLLYDFRAKYDKIKVYNETLNSKMIAKKIIEGEIDLGYIESKVINKELNHIKIGSDELIVVSRDKNLSKRSFFIDELYSRIWLLREEGSGTRETFFDAIKGLSNEIKESMVFSSFESIKRVLLKNNDAITCISKICVEEELKKGLLFEVRLTNLAFKRDFFMIYHKSRQITKIFEIFSTFSKSYFRDF